MSQESLFKSAVRSLLKTACTLLAFALVIVPIVFFISKADDEKLLKPSTQLESFPNANGKRQALDDKSPVVLVLSIEGIIGQEDLSAKTVRRALMESREGKLKKDRVKAVLLLINSPGGTVFDADGIYQALLQYKADFGVPIYAYTEGLAASGGMYVAAAADRIYSSDVGVIGSVGVILSSFVNVSELLENWGVQSKTIFAGRGKDAMNPLRSWQEGEDTTLQVLTDSMYERFVQVMTSNRPMEREALVGEYGASVFMAQDAKEKGFVDVAGASYRQALADLVETAGIEGSYRVVGIKPRNWFAEMFGGIFPDAPQTLTTWKLKGKHDFFYLYPGCL